MGNEISCIERIRLSQDSRCYDYLDRYWSGNKM